MDGDGRRRMRWAGGLVLAAILVLGAVDAWAGRRGFVTADGTAYVNMALAIASGHPTAWVNGIWSPLYPVILAVALLPVQSDMAAAFTTVRFVNFGIFLVAMACFAWFLRAFLAARDTPPTGRPPEVERLGRGAMEIAGWAAFAWASLGLNMVARVSPDMLVAACVFAAAAILLSFRQDQSRWRFVLFGAVLGLGYWVKAVLFPLGFVFLLAALIEPGLAAARRRIPIALAAFLAVSSPLILAQSLDHGALTYSRSGSLNYAWFVNGVRRWIHWQGGPAGQGEPMHRSRLIHVMPDAFAWQEPAGSPAVVSYHPWYDPAYWYAGASGRFDLAQQLELARKNARLLAGILLRNAPFLLPLALAGLSCLALMGWRGLAGELRRFAPLWVVGAAGTAIYLPIWIEPRYLTGFFCIGALLMLDLARYPAAVPRVGRGWRRIGLALPALCLAAAVGVAGPRLGEAAAVIFRTRGDVRDASWRLAEEFGRLRVPPGTPVASVGEAFRADWHLLARLRVVAEIPAMFDERSTGFVEAFWRLEPERRDAILEAFRLAGAQIAVATDVPAWADTGGWSHVAGSGFHFRMIGPPEDRMLAGAGG